MLSVLLAVWFAVDFAEGVPQDTGEYLCCRTLIQWHHGSNEIYTQPFCTVRDPMKCHDFALQACSLYELFDGRREPRIYSSDPFYPDWRIPCENYKVTDIFKSITSGQRVF